VMEMASASGLPLIPANRLKPMQSSTYGTGEMIRDALDEGCRKIILGIGGSATSDGGTGAAEALGVRFLDSDGNSVARGAEGLTDIAAVDISRRDSRIETCEILVACDVSNPLYGPEGAAFVYSPQKGATEEEVELIDRGLRNLAQATEHSLAIDIAHISGAGAAGGLGAGLVGFMGAALSSGITIIADLLKLDERMAGADLVITGEGKTDFQTAFGKVPAGVAERAARQGIPVVCLSGALGRNVETLYGTGITALFSTANSDMSLEYAFRHSPELIRQSTENIVRIFAAGAALS